MGYFEDFIGVNLWTALFTLLNTLTVIVVGTKFLFKPVMKMIAERQQEIDKLYAEADTAKENALEMEKEYTQKLSVATQTGEEMVQQAVARGQKREDEIIRQANERADAILEKATADIALEKKKALNEAKDEISDIAMAIAEKVVGREINSADHTDLVDGFIEQLGEQT